MRQGSHPRRSRSRGNGRRNHAPHRLNFIDSNGPSGRVRGNAQQVYEKYLGLARDAAASGDLIIAENLLQHAEHYFRLMQAHGMGPARGGNGNGNGRDGRGRSPADLVAEATGEFETEAATYDGDGTESDGDDRVEA